MQTFTPNPGGQSEGLSDRLTAYDSFIGGISTGDLPLTALIAPGNVAVTQQGTAGSTNYSYVVASDGLVGKNPASAVQTTTGNATLTAVNTNLISWNSQPGYTYRVYRSASSGTPSGTGLIGVVVATGSTASFTDTGITATAATIPTANTTGSISTGGPVFLGGVLLESVNVPSLNNASNQTLTPAQLLNGVLDRLGATAITDTLPTAALLVGALRGVQVNQGFRWTYRNRNSGNATLAMGTNGTAAANDSLVLATMTARTFLIQFTNVTSPTEAYTAFTLDALV